MNKKNNEEPKRKGDDKRLLLIIGIIVIGGLVLFNLDAIMWAFGFEKKTSTAIVEEVPIDDMGEKTTNDSSDIVLDTIGPNERNQMAKKSRQSSSYNSGSSNSYDDEDLNDDPEYRPGGKYDPAKYHTDYGRDEEQRRRNFIDNDGWDEVDGYDEYYGYEHENARSDQWKDDD